MKVLTLILILTCLTLLPGYGQQGEKKNMTENTTAPTPPAPKTEEFKYFIEKFADINIGRFKIPEFETLPLKQKEILYYFYEAALSGRDIYWDQRYKHNLKIRRTLEAIVRHYKGDRQNEDFKKFMNYVKQVWFSNGIHHHYSTDKIIPDFTPAYFMELVKNSPEGKFPLAKNQTPEQLAAFLTPILLDPKIDGKNVATDASKDLLTSSAVNFYENVTQQEVEEYYKKRIDPKDETPISYGLNSKMVKENGQLTEKVWKVGGMYSAAIEKIIGWLEKAVPLAENDQQRRALELLILFYKTGDLKTFDDYSIAWLKDTESKTDMVNGFIETYGDPISHRATFESVVSFRDDEATKRAKAISDNAQWFEDHSPILPEHKKKKVTGVSAKVITVAALGGDTAPRPPIGVNLPNANWIRKIHGSKSVTLGNIGAAFEKVTEGSGMLEEYAFSPEEIAIDKKYGEITDALHTDLHEIVGHGSGQINPGVGTPRETLKNYSSVIEETRADLVAYYYLMDPKLAELGLVPSVEAGKAAYNHAIRNGMLQQLTRIKLGDSIEQSHMRNRQLIAKWAMELGKSDHIIEKKSRDGKTFYVINHYDKLREIFGKMLREIQRITSEGDFQSAAQLVETYGVKIDPELHKEVLTRYEKLGVAPYTGFILPLLVPEIKDGKIIDVRVEYPEDFTGQMLWLSENYSFLPDEN